MNTENDLVYKFNYPGLNIDSLKIFQLGLDIIAIYSKRDSLFSLPNSFYYVRSCELKDGLLTIRVAVPEEIELPLNVPPPSKELHPQLLNEDSDF